MLNRVRKNFFSRQGLLALAAAAGLGLAVCTPVAAAKQPAVYGFWSQWVAQVSQAEEEECESPCSRNSCPATTRGACPVSAPTRGSTARSSCPVSGSTLSIILVPAETQRNVEASSGCPASPYCTGPSTVVCPAVCPVQGNKDNYQCPVRFISGITPAGRVVLGTRDVYHCPVANRAQFTRTPNQDEVHFRLCTLIEKVTQRTQNQSHEMQRVIHDQQHQIQQMTHKMDELLREVQSLRNQVQNLTPQPVFVPVPYYAPPYPNQYQPYTSPSPPSPPGHPAARPGMYYPVPPPMPATAIPAPIGPAIAVPAGMLGLPGDGNVIFEHPFSPSSFTMPAPGPAGSNFRASPAPLPPGAVVPVSATGDSVYPYAAPAVPAHVPPFQDFRLGSPCRGNW